MSRFRAGVLGVLTVLVALVASAGAASTASATFVLELTECTGGTTIAFCYIEKTGEVLLELKGIETFLVLKDEGKSFLKSNLGEEEVNIECTAVSNEVGGKATGELIQEAPLTTDYTVLNLVLVFTGCELLGKLGEKCKVPATLETNKLKGDPENDEATRKLTENEIRFIPEAGEGEAFITIPIEEKATCPATIVNTKNKVTGSQNCEWQEPLVDLLVHLLHCNAAASLLLFAKNPSEFELLVELKPLGLGEDLWDIEEAS